MVEIFYHDSHLRAEIIYLLKKNYDSQRVIQRISLGRRNADDLLILSKAIDNTNQIYSCLKKVSEKECISSLLKRITIPLDLFKKIQETIDEEGLLKKQKENEEMAAEAIKNAEEFKRVSESEDLFNHDSAELKFKNNRKDLKNNDTWVIKKEYIFFYYKYYTNLLVPHYP